MSGRFAIRCPRRGGREIAHIEATEDGADYVTHFPNTRAAQERYRSLLRRMGAEVTRSKRLDDQEYRVSLGHDPRWLDRVVGNSLRPFFHPR